ncbi:MAG: DNA-binding response regulator, partial [Nostocales cyanobacterium]
YCLKGVVAETLILALRSVAAGESWWDEIATQEIRSSLTLNSDQLSLENKSKTIHPLTHREIEILQLLAAGKTNHQIGEILYITTGTVRVHVHAILHKLGVGDRQTAVTVALQKQLISYPVKIQTL